VLLDERMVADAGQRDSANVRHTALEEFDAGDERRVVSPLNDEDGAGDLGEHVTEIRLEGEAFEALGVVVVGKDARRTSPSHRWGCRKAW
jgi:hypothetical protein